MLHDFSTVRCWLTQERRQSNSLPSSVTDIGFSPNSFTIVSLFDEARAPKTPEAFSKSFSVNFKHFMISKVCKISLKSRALTARKDYSSGLVLKMNVAFLALASHETSAPKVSPIILGGTNVLPLTISGGEGSGFVSIVPSGYSMIALE